MSWWKEQIGPLPAGAWAVAIVGGLGIGLMGRRNGSSSAPTEMVDTAGDPRVGVGPGGWVYDPPESQKVVAITTNEEWAKKAIDELIGMGYDPYLVDTAIRKYIGGAEMGVEHVVIVKMALARLGSPPSPLPPPYYPTPAIPTNPGTSPPPVVTPPVSTSPALPVPPVTDSPTNAPRYDPPPVAPTPIPVPTYQPVSYVPGVTTVQEVLASPILSQTIPVEIRPGETVVPTSSGGITLVDNYRYDSFRTRTSYSPYTTRL